MQKVSDLNTHTHAHTLIIIPKLSFIFKKKNMIIYLIMKDSISLLNIL